jgi:hypothetical protein
VNIGDESRNGGNFMREAKTFDAADVEPTDYKAAVIEYIKKVDGIRQQMAEEQEEVDRLKFETLEILARLEAA